MQIWRTEDLTNPSRQRDRFVHLDLVRLNVANAFGDVAAFGRRLRRRFTNGSTCDIESRDRVAHLPVDIVHSMLWILGLLLGVRLPMFLAISSSI